jgi:hypothetical protein
MKKRTAEQQPLQLRVEKSELVGDWRVTLSLPVGGISDQTMVSMSEEDLNTILSHMLRNRIANLAEQIVRTLDVEVVKPPESHIDEETYPQPEKGVVQ